MTTKLQNEWPSYLNEQILKVVNDELGFKTMTPVQSVVVPIFTQQHKDVVVEAVTGSGKTLAFIVPMINMLLKLNTLKKHDIAGLIITPTRELALQIFSIIETFFKHINRLTAIMFVGGCSLIEDQNRFFNNGGHIVVATAGRLEDLFSRSNLKVDLKRHIKTLEMLILDEADRLLDLGFKNSLQNILKYLPKQRRTGLFSATQTDEIDKLIRAGLRNPCCIQVKQKANVLSQKTPLTLKNYYSLVEPCEKFSQLVEFIKNKKSMKLIVFMSSCACVQYFSKLLKLFIKDFTVLALHRKVKEKRNKIFDQFKNLKNGIMVCTDILARGIDIEDVDWVIQFDPPRAANSFVHRCGRTARSGREGNALIYLLPNEECYVNFLHINQKVPLNKFEQVENSKARNEENIKKIQTLARTDRELYEKGKQAFVSFIRAYEKHECSHIFQVKELDLVELAKGFGLLHMPKMPEIKKEMKSIKFIEMDFSQIPYKDKAKEKQRLESLKNESLENKAKKKVKRLHERNKPWSNKSEKKLKKKIKLEQNKIVEKKRKNDEDYENDLKELQNDFNLLKKYKKY